MSAMRWTALAAMVGCALACSPDRREAPDVLLVTVDTLRADRLGAYGYAAARTPRVDDLARRGRRFTQATTPQPRTTPAFASLFTGLWPRQHGSHDVGKPLGPEFTTLAEVLERHGWTTLAVTSNAAASSKQGLDRGFERFVDHGALPGRTADAVTDRALELARSASGSRPLFLWAHYSDPHFPYEPPEPFASQSAGPGCRDLQRAAKAGEVPRGIMDSNWDGVAQRVLAECQSLYDAEIAFTDAEIGRLLDGLHELGRSQRALVVFTADHGENLGEQELYYEHGPSLHDASLRVPLIVAGPGVAPGVDDGPVVLQDLAPTLLAWVGLPADGLEGIDGRDVSPRLRGEPTVDRPVAFAESGRALHLHDFRRPLTGTQVEHCLNGPRFSLCRKPDGSVGLFDPRADPRLTRDVGDRHPEARQEMVDALARQGGVALRERSARTPRFKLVERPRWDGGVDRVLHDLESDPAEAVDVSDAHPEVAARLAAELAAWSGAQRDPAATALSDEEIELLRTLGYVE